jgi:predicted ester cyclase
MSTEENKAVAHRYLEETHNKGNLDVIDELCAPEFGAWQRDFLIMERNAFPDMHFTIEETIAEGDKVVLRITSRGTHLGEFHDWNGFGILAPTGKAWDCSHIFIYNFIDGKIAGGAAEHNILGLYQQLGVIPKAE